MTLERYTITVDGPVPDRLFEMLEAREVSTTSDRTAFESQVRDASELAGLMAKLCNLGVLPTSVERAEFDQYRADAVVARVRAMVGGASVLDSTSARLLHVVGEHPRYLVPFEGVDWAHFEGPDSGSRPDHPILGEGRWWNLRDGDGDALVEWEALPGLAQLDLDAADEWLEEDVPVLYHPRDPYRRVDARPSSRHIRYELDGTTIAESSRPLLVTETGLPPRWYVPMVDVDASVLRRSATTTGCQYKGEASYWSVDIDGTVHTDLVWAYRAPIAPVAQLIGSACVLAERVDTYLDGELQPRPVFDPVWLSPSLALG